MAARAAPASRRLVIRLIAAAPSSHRGRQVDGVRSPDFPRNRTPPVIVCSNAADALLPTSMRTRYQRPRLFPLAERRGRLATRREARLLDRGMDPPSRPNGTVSKTTIPLNEEQIARGLIS